VTDKDNSKDIKALQKMENRLQKLFNKCYDERNDGDDYEEDAKIADAAAHLAEAFISVRQQRMFESGETTEVIRQNSSSGNMTRYIRRTPQKKNR